MIDQLKLIDLCNKVIDKIDDAMAATPIDYNKVQDAKDDLITAKDEAQNEVDDFEKWADEESKRDVPIEEPTDENI